MAGHLSTAPAQDQISTRATKIKDLENAIRGNKAEEVKSLLKKDLGLIEETFSFTFYAKDSEVVEEIGEGLTPLILATRLGLSEIVGILLDNGANISAKAKNKEVSILELALERGDYSVARIILKRGKRADKLLELTRGRYKWTPLLQMTFNEKSDAVKFLLENNAKTDATDIDGDTALHLAAMQGYSDIAEKLIGKNASALENGNNDGETPLLMAARWGEDGVAGVLLRNGANREARNSDGDAPMHLAARFDRLDVVQRLFHYQGEGIKLLGMQNKLGETPYLIAARFEAVSSAQFFLDNGTNLSERDGNGNTALHLAAREGSLETAKLLVEKEKQLNLLDSTNKNSETPLLVAIQFERDNTVEYLLKTTANLEITDKDGNSALHLALGRWSTGMNLLEMLLTNERAKVKLLNMENNAGETPYLLAARKGDDEAVQTLGEYGANPNARDQDGNNALHLAAKHGMMDIVKRLLGEKPADPSKLEAKNNLEESPYLIAVKFDQMEAAQTFIEYGANSKACDKEGNSALHLASKSGHIRIMKELSLAEGQAGGSLNNQNDSPITLAAQARHLEVLEYLLSLNKGRIPRDIKLPGETMAEDFFESAKKGYMCLFKKILQSRGNLLDKKNELGKKALDLAVEANQIGILDYLLTRKRDFDTEGMNIVNMFNESASGGYLQIIKKILVGRNELIKYRYDLGKTALLIACENGHTDIVDYLCDNGAEIEAEDNCGNRALHHAVSKGNGSTVKSLLNRRANQTATNETGENALHMACSNRDTQIVELLLSDQPERVKKSIYTVDECGKTPLCGAVSSGDEDVIFQILESENYFPRTFVQDPTQDFQHPEKEQVDVSEWLTDWIQPKEPVNIDQKKKAPQGENVDDGEKMLENTKNSRVKSLICWAILNRDKSLLGLGMEQGSFPSLNDEANPDRKGANWLHLAALVGHREIVDEIYNLIVSSSRRKETHDVFWSSSIQEKASTRITPLQVAARMGHAELVEYFLARLAGTDLSSTEPDLFKEITEGTKEREKQTAVLQAIIQETEQEDNLITLTVTKAMQTSKGDDELVAGGQDKNRFQTLEDGLWKTVMSFIEDSHDYFDFPCTENAELLIKTVLWRDNMLVDNAAEGRDSFNSLRKLLNLNDDFKRNPLHWAVKERHPVAVHWLLSSGRYFTEPQIKACEKTIELWTTDQLDARLKREKDEFDFASHVQSVLEGHLAESAPDGRSETTDNPLSPMNQPSAGGQANMGGPQDPSKAEREEQIAQIKASIDRWATWRNEASKKIQKFSPQVTIERQIHKLIQNPPAVRPRKGDDASPQFNNSISEKDTQTATVLDLFSMGIR
ncbi:Mg2+ transporter protein CorA-like/Zinc transport protein ZntB [Penicillium herquei]|nr:Mg2+ transporter protein CorA-like/Zinc transport protein ZntB [Penicillium herquei]